MWMGHEVGRRGDREQPFQDQVVGDKVTKEFLWKSCEVERIDENVV
jgi:hypothetical protein